MRDDQLTFFDMEPPREYKAAPGTVERLRDYDGFVEKFKAKKTTDDCFTPPLVMTP